MFQTALKVLTEVLTKLMKKLKVKLKSVIKENAPDLMCNYISKKQHIQ